MSDCIPADLSLHSPSELLGIKLYERRKAEYKYFVPFDLS